MKNIFYSLLITTLLVSCKSHVKTTIKADSITAGKTPGKTNPIVEKFNPFLHGVWVSSSYIEDLSRTKSPYSSSGLGGVASFQIGKLSPEEDSTHIGYSLGNHEGSDFILYFKTGQKSTTLKTNLQDFDVKGSFCELGYIVNNNDTSLAIYHYNKEKHLVATIKYTKVADKASNENDAAWGIQYITNKTLFAGKYISTDTIGATSKVQFTNDGKISGLLHFKDYYINTDFAASADDTLDEIVFDLYAKKNTHYSFKMDADTLNLFKGNFNPDSTELISGKRIYKLVKQK